MCAVFNFEFQFGFSRYGVTLALSNQESLSSVYSPCPLCLCGKFFRTVYSPQRTRRARRFMTNNHWPTLILEEWQDTLATLHMWTQIVGKIRMKLTQIGRAS